MKKNHGNVFSDNAITILTTSSSSEEEEEHEKNEEEVSNGGSRLAKSPPRDSQAAARSPVPPQRLIKKRTKKKKKLIKNKKVDILADGNEALEVLSSEVTEPVVSETSDNIVLRKLLRGPRYFNAGINNWINCRNCGGEDHDVSDCTAEVPQRRCFICGMFGHNNRQCLQAKICNICKSNGHIARWCPDKNRKKIERDAKVCLRCGGLGHDMFSCQNDYDPDDLKEIECYICRTPGHLCCIDIVDCVPAEVSCYNCAQIGHIGSECVEADRENFNDLSHHVCYKCGEEGHLTGWCPNSSKLKKMATKTHALNSEIGNKSEKMFAKSTSSRKRRKSKKLIGHLSAPTAKVGDWSTIHSEPRPISQGPGENSRKNNLRHMSNTAEKPWLGVDWNGGTQSPYRMPNPNKLVCQLSAPAKIGSASHSEPRLTPQCPGESMRNPAEKPRAGVDWNGGTPPPYRMPSPNNLWVHTPSPVPRHSITQPYFGGYSSSQHRPFVGTPTPPGCVTYNAALYHVSQPYRHFQGTSPSSLSPHFIAYQHTPEVYPSRLNPHFRPFQGYHANFPYGRP